MAETMPEPEATASNRRSFLKKAGVAAGAAWVAPTVLSQAAHAQGSSPARFRVPVPPLGPVEPLGTFGGVPWFGGSQQIGPAWQSVLIPGVNIGLIDLDLSPPAPITVSPPPSPTPGTPVPGNSPIIIDGAGPIPIAPSFFDVFVTLQ